MSTELAYAGERQRKAGRLDAQQRGIDIGCRRIVDRADKAQRQMELAGCDPARAWHARIELRETEFELQWDEEARHGRLSGGGIAAFWPVPAPERPPPFAGT